MFPADFSSKILCCMYICLNTGIFLTVKCRTIPELSEDIIVNTLVDGYGNPNDKMLVL